MTVTVHPLLLVWEENRRLDVLPPLLHWLCFTGGRRVAKAPRAGDGRGTGEAVDMLSGFGDSPATVMMMDTGVPSSCGAAVGGGAFLVLARWWGIPWVMPLLGEPRPVPLACPPILPPHSASQKAGRGRECRNRPWRQASASLSKAWMATASPPAAWQAQVCRHRLLLCAWLFYVCAVFVRFPVYLLSFRPPSLRSS